MFIHSLGLRQIDPDKIKNLFAEFLRGDSLGQVGGKRSKNVAGMKRVAYGLQAVIIRGRMVNPKPFFAVVDKRKHAIVGSDKMILLGGCHNGRSHGAHSGIDDCHMRCASGKVGIGLGDGQRAIQNIKCLHGMADVHNLGIWNDVENDSLHRPHEVVVESEIGG